MPINVRHATLSIPLRNLRKDIMISFRSLYKAGTAALTVGTAHLEEARK
jgi:hypothetical protein